MVLSPSSCFDAVTDYHYVVLIDISVLEQFSRFTGNIWQLMILKAKNCGKAKTQNTGCPTLWKLTPEF